MWNLVEIRHNTDGNAANDVVYSFEQDALGRQTAVKVGNQTTGTLIHSATICCLQKSRFTASKPSIFAIASDEKFIRHLVTSFHQRSLSQSQYQNDPTKPNFGALTATTYGNGAKVSSRYDDFNRVTGVVYGEETAPRYEYDYNARVKWHGYATIC